MDQQNNIEPIILAFLQHSITEENMKTLQAWLEQSEKNKELFFQIKNLYELREGGLYPTEDEMKRSKKLLFDKINNAEEKEEAAHIKLRKRKNLISIYKYVAVAVVCVCSTLGMQFLLDSKNGTQYTELAMESGPRMGHMTLPDGTKVILNASTRLRFPDKFEKNLREVFLDGEAYFDVTRNEKAPFIVYTDKQKISVLGTTFNVMDYSVDDYAITTLVSGKIQMQTVDETGALGKPVILKPSQQMFFNKQTKHLALSAVKLDMDRIWVNKVYHFKDEPLAQIASRLEKLYGVKIHIQNEELKNVECTGTFGLEQELDEILHIINLDKFFTYRTVDDEIFIE